MPPVLELKTITKRFPGVLANDRIDLSLERGEIHALLGENGAGKTTLMNILYGLYQPDEGEIFINGRQVQIHSPTDAINAGIGMVHQHFMLIPVFTVTENVMLGSESLKMGGILDRRAATERIRQISSAYGLEVDPDDYVRDLPVGVQQRVEIIKLLYREADILILDEPTAVLTPQEADELFKIMHSLTERGKSIIFITHKLREVLDIADRITVIRRGKVVGSTTPKQANQSKLAAMMVGREVDLSVHKRAFTPGADVLTVQNLKVGDDRGQIAVDDVSFTVRAGEVLGIAGVQGNGQTELVEALTGLRPALDGSVRLLNEDVTRANPRRITELGTAHIPEDRQRDGLVLSFPVADNLVLNTYYQRPFSKGAVLQQATIAKVAEERVNSFDIRTPSVDTSAASLSGGNQQKVIVARELSRPVKLVVASQPTRGLDVGSIEYIHGRLIESRDNGGAVLLVSSELDEIMQLSDRIAVIYRGKIVDVLSAQDASKEKVGLLMAGVVRTATAKKASLGVKPKPKAKASSKTKTSAKKAAQKKKPSRAAKTTRRRKDS
ncbi:MAG: ABC transporter ATP-binding protein [Anaerolineales bacterium]|nr:ABC transporter ATP-binding protein [Anaerolineales bacterium]